MKSSTTLIKLITRCQQNPQDAIAYTKLRNALKKWKPDYDVEDLLEQVIDCNNLVESKLVSFEHILMGRHERVLAILKEKLSRLGAGFRRDTILSTVLEARRLPLALRYIQDSSISVAPEVIEYSNEVISVVNRLYGNNSTYITTQTPQTLLRGYVVTALLMLHYNTKVDNRLMKALDFNSLVRLSVMHGGETITVPTWAEVEQTITTVYFYYLRHYKDMNNSQAISAIHEELGITIKDIPALNDDYQLLLKMINKELRDGSSTINSQFQMTIQKLESLQTSLEDVIKSVEDPQALAKLYAEVNRATLTLAGGIVDKHKTRVEQKRRAG